MSTTTEISETLRRILQEPARGVVGVVDDLLAICREFGLQLDWQSDRCLVRGLASDWEERIDIALPKPVFRAILARIATLCNDRIPNSVSPYGGSGEISVGENPSSVFRVTFVNTPIVQKLGLRTENENREKQGNPQADCP